MKTNSNKIKPTIFSITEKEIRETIKEMVQNNELYKTKLKKEQIIEILAGVECDELLAEDIQNSIRNSIFEILI